AIGGPRFAARPKASTRMPRREETGERVPYRWSRPDPAGGACGRPGSLRGGVPRRAVRRRVRPGEPLAVPRQRAPRIALPPPTGGSVVRGVRPSAGRPGGPPGPGRWTHSGHAGAGWRQARQPLHPGWGRPWIPGHDGRGPHLLGYKGVRRHGRVRHRLERPDPGDPVAHRAPRRLGAGPPQPGPGMGRPPVVLVTGAGGQVGTALRARLGSARFMGRSELDVTDRKAVHRAVGGAGLVVHLAAMTNVDECEARPDAAFA